MQVHRGIPGEKMTGFGTDRWWHFTNNGSGFGLGEIRNTEI
jgi:hypothetical protein